MNTQRGDAITLLLFFHNKGSRQRKDMILSVSPLPNNLRIMAPEEMAVARQ
jgi:hypothetical protein